MAFSVFGAADVQKLLKKHRIAARMISDDIRRARKASDKHYERSQELIKCEKEHSELKSFSGYMIDLNEKNHEYIKKLQKEIEELQEELEINYLENAHLEGKIAAYEKILKIEK